MGRLEAAINVGAYEAFLTSGGASEIFTRENQGFLTLRFREFPVPL
jgi:hypothetical protein